MTTKLCVRASFTGEDHDSCANQDNLWNTKISCMGQYKGETRTSRANQPISVVQL